MFTWLLFLSQSAAPPHFPALLSRRWKISLQTRGKWQTRTRKTQISPKNAQKKFLMWHSWLWLLEDQSSVITLPILPRPKNFWTNFNPITGPGRHLPDIISYQPNENWWLAKDTNRCCHWEKGLNGSSAVPPRPGLPLATQTLSDRADAISCPPQSWQAGHWWWSEWAKACLKMY